METKGDKGKRLGLNIRPEVAEKLLLLKMDLLNELGVNLSASGVVEYLINQHYNKEK